MTRPTGYFSQLANLSRFCTGSLPHGRATAPAFANLTSHAYFRGIDRVVTPIMDLIFLQPLGRDLLKCASFEFVPGIFNAHRVNCILKPAEGAATFNLAQQILTDLTIFES